MSEALRCRLYEKGWQYTKHESTDIRILFARVRAELEAKQPKPANVRPIKKAAK